MTPVDVLLIGAGGFAAGAVNAVAGGGTFFSFPALLAVGVPPVVANASNSVALWPGSLTGAWAYRRELARYKRYLLPMGIASLLGGVAGGLLLLAAGDARFSALIPWLLAFATLLFAFSPQLSAALKRMRPPSAANAESGHGAGSPAGWAVQLLVSIYGGFFGAGMGILMMASLAIGGHEDVQHINALKNLLSAVIYSVTVVTFVVAGAVSWPHTLVMLLTASLGGYGGARLARNIQGPWLRRVVIAVGSALSLYYFYKTLG
ncbi:MAG: sulfite exporter TauE/SafE family protein [Polaromonas sp.]|uniref:sulfite exporter TauE/SafE family protein n=1 Tax=Polaromonas sp. TaxID=1869339 RepID=UPI00273134C2|nr:sulfite exporter TauE/SafE family protein [Polaromonas sp.]MDP2254746.1 sulfite exporter TauE/SafE family protein [Polaromonas sp.]